MVWLRLVRIDWILHVFLKKNEQILLTDCIRVFRERDEPKMIAKLFFRATGRPKLPFTGR